MKAYLFKSGLPKEPIRIVMLDLNNSSWMAIWHISLLFLK